MNPADFWTDYNRLLFPLFVFAARILDVTLGTLRIIFVSRGQRRIAPVLGFFEVLIWITAVGQIVRNIHDVSGYLAYAAGFAVGNYIGMRLEQRLGFGTVAIRIFVPQGGEELAHNLHTAGYGVTILDGRGATGPVKVLFTLIPRWALEVVTGIIHRTHPKAFFSIEEVRSTTEGVFPLARGSWQAVLRSAWRNRK